jgi:hypothetical protein
VKVCCTRGNGEGVPVGNPMYDSTGWCTEIALQSKRPRVSGVTAGFGGAVGQVGVLLVADLAVDDPVTGST